jgi:hypothetical protein
MKMLLIAPIALIALAMPTVRADVFSNSAVVVVVGEKCRGPNCFVGRNCNNGQCATRVYGVDARNVISSRERVLGGTVTRKNSRTVLRPVR